MHRRIRRLHRLAERQHGVFTLQQALRYGVTADVVRRAAEAGRWERVARGVYRVAGSPPTWRQHLLTAVLVAGEGAVASFRSAAALYGIPGFDEGPIEVTVPRHSSRRGATGRVHETDALPRGHVRLIDGIPVTSPARTLFDLCGVFRGRTHGRAQQAVSNALRMGIVSPAQLRATLVEIGARGRAGTAGMRQILRRVDTRKGVTLTELEKLFLKVVARAGLPSPQAQVSVGGTRAPIGRVDFVYAAARLVVEADSRAHHSSWAEIEADRRRDALLMAAGWRVLRVTWLELVEEPEIVIAALRAAFAEGAAARAA